MEHLTRLKFDEILNGELVVAGRLVDASNATLLCEIKSSHLQENLKVVYKPMAGERPLWDFPEGNLASREVAAYLLSDFAKFGIVPLTVLRDGPFGPGAVQEWIEVDSQIDLIAFAQGDDPRLREMAIFDYIINNTDRKFGHILLDSSGSIYGCDHGVSFHQDYKLRTVLWQFAGLSLNESEGAKVDRLVLHFGDLANSISSLIAEREIESLKDRIESLAKNRSFPYPNPEWPAIPWPPV